MPSSGGLVPAPGALAVKPGSLEEPRVLLSPAPGEPLTVDTEADLTPSKDKLRLLACWVPLSFPSFAQASLPCLQPRWDQGHGHMNRQAIQRRQCFQVHHLDPHRERFYWLPLSSVLVTLPCSFACLGICCSKVGILFYFLFIGFFFFFLVCALSGDRTQ